MCSGKPAAGSTGRACLRYLFRVYFHERFGWIQGYGAEIALDTDHVLYPDSHCPRLRLFPYLEAKHGQDPVRNRLQAAGRMHRTISVSRVSMPARQLSDLPALRALRVSRIIGSLSSCAAGKRASHSNATTCRCAEDCHVISITSHSPGAADVGRRWRLCAYRAAFGAAISRPTKRASLFTSGNIGHTHENEGRLLVGLPG